jgi:hypothetical protein
MNKITSIIYFLLFCFLLFIFFKKSETFVESMTNNNSDGNGIAGNAQSFASTIKNKTIQNMDEFLITKYRKDYENVILNLDDYVNTLLLKTSLEFDTTQPMMTIDKLGKLNESKQALNTIMKFIDKAS